MCVHFVFNYLVACISVGVIHALLAMCLALLKYYMTLYRILFLHNNIIIILLCRNNILCMFNTV